MTGNQPDGFRELNVIPLVDVMLVLLIVFMATAPLLHQGLNVQLPEPGVDVAALDESPGLDLAIDETGRTFVDGKATDDLAARLRGIPARTTVSVRADRAVRYEAVAEVIAVAQAAGLERVTLVVDGR